MTSAWMALIMNVLFSSSDAWTPLRTQFHVRTWRILHSRTLSEAVRVITAEERSCSANFLLGQANGRAEVVDIEAAPHAACTLAPADGLLAHPNHFVDHAALGLWQRLAERKTSTYQRAARMHHLLPESVRAGTAHAPA